MSLILYRCCALSNAHKQLMPEPHEVLRRSAEALRHGRADNQDQEEVSLSPCHAAPTASRSQSSDGERARRGGIY